jgi:hypothetical protein
MWKNVFSFTVCNEMHVESAGVTEIEERHIEDFSK